MGLVMFYHLTQSSAEQTARTLLGRALGQGWRIMIRGTDPAALDRLDDRLWDSPPETFLPHGREGGPQDARQPVLLGQGAITNGARGLMLMDGAEVSPAEVQAMERVWVLFDAHQPEQMQMARRQWKALTEAGLAAQYWSEESGSWVKKAEKA